MCAIAGVFGKEDEATVAEMVAIQARRGPDDQHIVSVQGATLGAARLAIMDPEQGRQPAVSDDGKVVVAFNGELYMDTHGCDTWALPKMYQQHGWMLPEHIDGMFAIAVWDVTRQEGMLVRDRMGKKPLHYWTDNDGALWFASEPKALFVVPGFERKVDFYAIRHYLEHRYVRAPGTAWQGVRLLEPGGQMGVHPSARCQSFQRYWSLPVGIEVEEGSEEEIAASLLDRLRAAVVRRLKADAPLGFFLSGGLDSSLILALAAEVGHTPLRTFTLGYERGATAGKEADLLMARSVANYFGTEHTPVYITPESFRAALPEIVRALDVPFSGVLSSWFLSKGVREAGVKVALCGDGADELFGSYATHRAAAERGGEALNRVLAEEFETTFANGVLTYADRLSMAHGLEVRSPFLDRSVVEYAARIPGEYKIRNGVCKAVLKTAARKLLPDWIVDRKKEGFISPRDVWLSHSLRQLVDEMLTPNRTRPAGLDPDRVAGAVSRLEEGGWQTGREVWKLLMLVLWHEEYALDLR